MSNDVFDRFDRRAYDCFMELAYDWSESPGDSFDRVASATAQWFGVPVLNAYYLTEHDLDSLDAVASATARELRVTVETMWAAVARGGERKAKEFGGRPTVWH